MKRKRKSKPKPEKKRSGESKISCSASILHEYYHEVLSLKEYLLKTPASRRLQRLLAVSDVSGLSATLHNRVRAFLDTAIVGCSPKALNEDLGPHFHTFSQQLSSSGGSERKWLDCQSSQAELVDFAIWLLFNKKYPFAQRPPHLLCQGLVRASATWQQNHELYARCNIPGLSCIYPNEYVETLKNEVWVELLRLMGQHGEKVMIDLVLDCGVFWPIKGSNIYQISGPIFTQLPPISSLFKDCSSKTRSKIPSDISFYRNRILYSRPILNMRGAISYGFSRDHVLNQYQDASDTLHSLTLLSHIFPRQFGLSNVFDSQDRKLSKHVPKRLRHQAFALVQKLQKLHKTCSYSKLLSHYCPLQKCGSSTLDDAQNAMVHATPVAHVMAFVQSTLTSILPLRFFGNERSNWKCLMKFVKNFLHARKFESFTLEDALCGHKIKGMPWLRPVGMDSSENMSATDHQKRKEIFAEWIYFVLDSLVIPIIRGHFFVTNSSSYRNRLFYFRHDVWRRLTEPRISQLKTSMFEPICNATTILQNRKLGYSQIRMLPKVNGMRPIANLKKSYKLRQHGELVSKKSINSSLRPVFSILNHEKLKQAAKLGSTMWKVSDLLNKLQAFKNCLGSALGDVCPNLYFVKVDVQSCFDSLPQHQLTMLMKKIIAAEKYQIHRYTKVEVLESKRQRRSFREFACSGARRPFREVVVTSEKLKTLFVDSVVPQLLQKDEVEELLSHHVEQNIVRIGKRYYRQKRGIPQGSILSSILCNFLYGDFENTHLVGLRKPSNLIVRLVDDFLFISPSKEDAESFLTIMSKGNDDYGISIKPEKSLTNFEFSIGGKSVPRINADAPFPYCGVLISSMDLNISKVLAVKTPKDTTDSLTMDLFKTPGQSMRRRILNTLKIGMQTMLLDMSLNTIHTVLENIYLNMVDVATKVRQYVKALSIVRRPSSKIIISMIRELEVAAYSLMKSKGNRDRSANYKCPVSRCVVARLTREAFLLVFGRSQTQLQEVLAWLRDGC